MGGVCKESERVKAAEAQDTSVWAPAVPVGNFTQLSGDAVRGFIEGDGPRKYCEVLWGEGLGGASLVSQW